MDRPQPPAETGAASPRSSTSNGAEERRPPTPKTDDGSPLEVDTAEAEAEAIELNRIRDILIGGERDRIERVEEAIATRRDVVSAEQVAEVLPAAVARRIRSDDRLATALSPTIEKTLEVSIESNPEKLASALSPVMMPAIRKSIAQQIKAMIQGLNRTLELGFSARGLKWRLEAARTGRPFAEVVLLRSMIYRVERVFLVHRETALLLAEAGVDQSAFDNADLVASMLTAIQDFVRDSFGREDDRSELSTLEFGDHTIWIEQGESMVLAGVIRGTAPVQLRATFQNTLAELHRTHRRDLAEFSGDVSPFQPSVRDLSACCRQASRESSSRKFSPLLGMVLMAIIAGLAFWAVSSLTERAREQEFLRLLDREAGIVVSRTEHRGGVLRVVGLRDPFAVDPQRLVEVAQLESDDVELHFEEFRSLDPRLLLAAARKQLNVPDTVELDLTDDRILVATGEATMAWADFARDHALRGLGLPIDTRGLVLADQSRLDRAIRALEVLPLPIYGDQQADLFAFQRTAVPQLLRDLDEVLVAQGRRATVAFRPHGLSNAPSRSELEAMAKRWVELYAEFRAESESPLQACDVIAGPVADALRAEHWQLGPQVDRLLIFEVEVTTP